MSRPSRSASSRPRTGPNHRRYSAAGDIGNINLDEELRTVMKKEYDEGLDGKNEALHDVKSVLNEVSKEPMAQAMEKVLPRFLAEQTSGESVTEEASHPPVMRSRSKNATPRHAKLTARPSARGKSHPRHLLTGETSSVPNIPPKTMVEYDTATTRPVTSAPKLPESTSKYSSTSILSEKQTETSMTEEVVETYGTETLLMSSVTESGYKEGEEDEEEVPFTENLMELRKDEDDPEEVWKSDIVKLTRLKSAPKGSTTTESDSLELRYKEPIWPHQLHLNQILARRTRLTHLVLDGSELRFLRDLGSNLQSLITLSVCDCGLRSLDGVYAFPNLRTLIARKNKIKIPSQCSFLTQLCYLDLSSNPIPNFDDFGNLLLCGELRILKLHSTPVATFPNFNKEIKQRIPQLKEIHPSQYDILEELKQIRKQSQLEQVEESTQLKDNIMPSLSYNDVMVHEPKSGIAYQKLPKTKENVKANIHRQQVEAEESGDFTEVYMAPMYLQHLEEAMPPSTAEFTEFEPDTSVAPTALSYIEEIYEDETETADQPAADAAQKKETDQVVEMANSKNHPRGDGDS